LPKIAEVVSVTALDTLLKASAAAEENRFSIEDERERTLAILSRVLSITHREAGDFKPLQECNAKIAELRNGIAKVAWPHRHAEAESILAMKHPATALLSFLENLETLEDDRWIALETTITEHYGKPLFVAASRGKLVLPAAAAKAPAPVNTPAKPAPVVAEKTCREESGSGEGPGETRGSRRSACRREEDRGAAGSARAAETRSPRAACGSGFRSKGQRKGARSGSGCSGAHECAGPSRRRPYSAPIAPAPVIASTPIAPVVVAQVPTAAAPVAPAPVAAPTSARQRRPLRWLPCPRRRVRSLRRLRSYNRRPPRPSLRPQLRVLRRPKPVPFIPQRAGYGD